jgi:hypothetical protein
LADPLSCLMERMVMMVMMMGMPMVEEVLRCEEI